VHHVIGQALFQPSSCASVTVIIAGRHILQCLKSVLNG